MKLLKFLLIVLTLPIWIALAIPITAILFLLFVIGVQILGILVAAIF